MNQTPRETTGRARTVVGGAQDLAPANPFRPVVIPKLKRPVTIQNEMPTSLSSGGAQRYNHILKKKSKFSSPRNKASDKTQLQKLTEDFENCEFKSIKVGEFREFD